MLCRRRLVKNDQIGCYLVPFFSFFILLQRPLNFTEHVKFWHFAKFNIATPITFFFSSKFLIIFVKRLKYANLKERLRVSSRKKFRSSISRKIDLPDSEWELWLELTVEVEHSDTERLLWIASTWVDNSSRRRLRYLCSRSRLSLWAVDFRSFSSRLWKM